MSQELIKKAAEAAGVPAKTAKAVIDSFISAIREDVVDKGEITINGFAKFKTVEAKDARNPKTGVMVKPSCEKVIKCTLSKTYKSVK